MPRPRFAQLFCLIFPILTEALVHECNFDGEKTKAGTHQNLSTITPLAFSQTLPPYRTLSHSCIVTTDHKDSFLYVKAKTSKETSGALHMSVYGEDESSLGHRDTSESRFWSTSISCPQNSSQRYLVLLTGTPNVRYAAEISESVSSIDLGESKSFVVSQTESAAFQFEPTKGISKKQLDITVESSSSISAYLKVSDKCEDVVNDIDKLEYDKRSLRLTFAEKGRITLSKASLPPLQDSVSTWFIGIAVKGKSTTGIKNVTLTLKSSFNYDYGTPFYFLIGLSFFGGVVVALWALFCFREPYILAQEDNHIDDSVSYSSSSSTSHRIKDNLKSLFSSCWKKKGEDHAGELRPLLRAQRDKNPLTWKELYVAMKTVLVRHWFAQGPKTFSYTTCIVGFVLLVGAFQFVFEDWHLMIDSGDRDKCYYNDFCYRVSGYDIPFNLMISNLVYMIHGLILAWSVWVMEAELFAWCHRLARRNRLQTYRLPAGQVELPKHILKCPNINAHLAKMTVPHFQTSPEEAILLHAEAHKRKYTFSIGYALAWGLVFEGCFSMLYHFCPTRLTFQFDTAFMFIISGLIVLSLYNGISYKECTVGKRVQRPVQGNNFYLFFIVPLFIFNYFGSLSYSNPDSLGLTMKIMFVICLVAYYIIIFSWVGLKLFYNISHLSDLKKCDALTKAGVFLMIMVIVCIVLPIYYGTDSEFPNMFLFSCISSCLLSVAGKVMIQFWRSERSHWTFQKIMFRLFQTSYVLVTLGVMGTAVWIFTAKATTDKAKSPEASRDLNQDCAIVGFFDYHDLWHILSSFALLMGAYLMLYISE